MKQTFNIPDGCKTVSVEQVGNQIITSFEPEKYVPKVGDCVKRTSEYGDVVFGVVKDTDCTLGECVDSKGEYYERWDCFRGGYFEKLTPEEFQAEFEKLGYVYDFERHTAHKKRWRAESGCTYYFVSAAFDVDEDTEVGFSADDKRHKNGNYFETKEECQKYCDYMRECSLKYFNK